MDLNESTYNLFDDFLSGKLSESDKLEFEKSLSENESVREEFSFYNAAVTTIRMSGNKILKKQLAEIGMGIPATAFQKYSPSIKPKNFLRKYWWAVATAAVLAVASWYYLKHHNDEGGLFGHDSSLDKMECPKPDPKNYPEKINPPTDSCIDSFSVSKENPVPSNPPAGKPPNDSIIECNSFSMSIFPKNGYTTFRNDGNNQRTDNSFTTSAYTAWKDGKKINVTFCKQNQKTPFYKFGEEIDIFSTYTDSTNISFYEMSDNELVMRDNKPGYFILKRSGRQNEVPLIRVSPGGARQETTDTLKSLIKNEVKVPVNQKAFNQ